MIHYRHGRYTDKAVPLDPTSPGFRYGAGFFETIYYSGHHLCHVALHLDRLFHALRTYSIPYQSIDFEGVIQKVLDKNGLTGTPARVNIIYPVQEPQARPIVLAAPYTPSPYKAYRLCICSERHVSSLNVHKTTSYMFFHLAHKAARECGFDDAALFDLDNTLLESTTGAIVFRQNGEFVEPDTPFKLPSTALALAKAELDIFPKPIPLDDLGTYRHAYLLNSLIGMRPIVAIGETAFVPDESPCTTVTRRILGGDASDG